MEQIAVLKLAHLTAALKKLVNIFMLDLDVGFLDNPMKLVNQWNIYKRVDLFVQAIPFFCEIRFFFINYSKYFNYIYFSKTFHSL
jgi:hypothetical protein